MITYKLVLIALLLVIAAHVLAQSQPTVEIVLSQLTAKRGDIVTAEVYVRNGVHVGGIDVGITADSDCLLILDRHPGSYLPTTDAEGAFSPFSELNAHETRLAAALTDRTKYASGDGVFYRVRLQVTCDHGVAPLTVSYAKISTYKDPTAVPIQLISYAQSDATLTTTGTQLAIAPVEQVTSTAPTTPAAVPTATPTPVKPPTDTRAPQTLLVMIIAVIIMVLALIGLIILLVLYECRRRR